VTSVAAPEEAAAAPRTWVDRIVAAVPLLSVFLWLCMLYAWQARNHASPWLFSDELEFSQLSRSIAETGHAARRGDPHYFDTLYVYVLAPAWRLASVGDAYAVVKYIGVFTMTAVVFPTYFLTRTIVSKPAALFSAAAAGAIPALAYAPMIVSEPLSYPYAALCFFLIVKALATRRRGWVAGAVVVSLLAPLVRGQLAIVTVVFFLATLVMLWTSERGRRWRSSWSTWDWVGAVVLAVVALVLFSALVGWRSHTWATSSGHYRGRMIDYGLWAGGALTIGLGVLPVVAGLTALFRPRHERRTPELRAFTAVVLAAILCFGLYTANKAAFLSTVFATRVEERNLIYLSPLLLAAMGLWIDRPRVRLVPLGCIVGFVAYLIVALNDGADYGIHVHFYSDAPGLAIVEMANRNLAFTADIAMWVLLATLAISVLLLLLPTVLARRRRASVAVAALGCGLVLAWTLTGQISFSNGSNSYSRTLLANFPKPPSWLDEADGGQPALYLGQNVQDPTGIWLTEFWNRSLRYVWSIDGTAKGPGPVLTPDLAAVDGRLYPDPKVPYVLADPGVDVAGQPVGTYGRWTVYRVRGPLRLAHSQTGLFSDGWIGCSVDPCLAATAAYSRYTTPGGRPGYALVTVSRAAANGAPIKPGNVVIRLGRLVKGSDRQPHLGRVTAVRRWRVRAGAKKTFVIPTLKPPFRIEVVVSPTFSPADYGESDPRHLGAQVSFSFSLAPPAGSGSRRAKPSSAAT
jgi:hypothetical protein